MEDFLKSGKFLIIGFNSRPTLKSASKLGINTIYDIDFFGDLDLLELSNNIIIISDLIKEKIPKKSVQDIFYNQFEKIIKDNQDISYVILTSGFENRPDIWKKMENIKPIIGNSAETIKKVRDVNNLWEFCKASNFKFPNYVDLNLSEDITDLDFPLIFKPKSSGGGQNIHLINDSNQFMKILSELSNKNEYIVQEFVEGVDISATISCNGEKSSVLGITKQILGEKFLGATSEFLYCGNIIPFKVNNKIYKEIKKISNELTKKFNLKGINGIDFILKNNELYLIEINPRFPGTIELLEILTHKNIFYEHVKSSIFNEVSEIKYDFKQLGVKFILYSTKDMKIGELNSIEGIYDIPLSGSIIKNRDPICTMLIIGDELDSIWDEGVKKVQKILELCG